MSRDDLISEESDALVLCLSLPLSVKRAGCFVAFVFCLGIVSLSYHVIARERSDRGNLRLDG
jgi:hypothetical protein